MIRGFLRAGLIAWSCLWLVPDAAFSQDVGSPPSAEALAASLPPGPAKRPKLKNPAAFGLLGLLENHVFRTFDRNGDIAFVTFTAVDSKTITWNNRGDDTSEVGVRLLPDGTLGWVRRNKRYDDSFQLAKSKPDLTSTSFVGYVMNEAGDLTLKGRMYGGGSVFGLWAMSHYPKISNQEATDAYKNELSSANALCPAGDVVAADCAVFQRAAANYLALTSQASAEDVAAIRRDAQASEAINQERKDQLQARIDAAREEGYANVGNTLGLLSQTQGMFSAQHQARIVAQAPSSSSNSLYVAQSVNSEPNRFSQQVAPFGSLPTGVGTTAQRQFWAEKCEGRPNDGSPAAQGCQQTRQSLHLSPQQTASSSSQIGGVTSYGNSVSQRSGSAGGSSQAPTPVHCVSMRPKPGASMGFWEVVNQCSFTVIGSFCYDDDSTDGCRNHGGGFGPISAGQTEGVSPPKSNPGGTISYHTHQCKYDEWDKGVCKLAPF